MDDPFWLDPAEFERVCEIMDQDRIDHPDEPCLTVKARRKIAVECPGFQKISESPAAALLNLLRESGVPSAEVMACTRILWHQFCINPSRDTPTEDSIDALNRECPLLCRMLGFEGQAMPYDPSNKVPH